MRWGSFLAGLLTLPACMVLAALLAWMTDRNRSSTCTVEVDGRRLCGWQTSTVRPLVKPSMRWHQRRAHGLALTVAGRRSRGQTWGLR